MPEQAATGTYAVPRAETAPDIELLDFPAAFERLARPIVLDQPERVILYRDNWQGPADLGCRAWLLHTDRSLFFAARVTDDEVRYAGHPGEWSGDAVNLFLKTETEEGIREFIFKFSCAGTRYCYFDRQSYNGEEFAWGESRAGRDEGGYWVAAEIPKRNLGLLGYGGEELWFNLSVEDNARGGYMILLGRSEGFLNAPAWAALELE